MQIIRTSKIIPSVLGAIFLASVSFTGCEHDSGSGNNAAMLLLASGALNPKLTGVSISGNSRVAPGSSITLTAAPSSSGIGSPSVSYTWSVTSGSSYLDSSTPNGASFTAAAKSSAADDSVFTVSVTATSDGKSFTATKSVTITSAASTVIRASDTPIGYASITPQTGSGTVVTTKSQFISALASGGLIYVSGTIDMSEGCLPTTAGGTTSALDTFVQEQTTSLHASDSSKYPQVFSSYTEFKNSYASLCTTSTNDKSSTSTSTTLSQTLWKLNSAYGNKIKISPISNTTIIGLDGAVIKGGTFQISNKSNIVIRNLTIKDAYDPFPHHEAGDGFNAQWDGIVIDNSSNIWIDHCTIEDTMTYTNVSINNNSSTTEKWQNYDGLCDIKNGSANIVVSYCLFQKHDKTMLIGSGTSDTSGGSITLHHNKFYNCGQRLPLTAYANMHIYNNSFERDANFTTYSQQACIAGRYGVYTIVAENNYFGDNVTKCLTTSTDANGSCYSSGNVFSVSSAVKTLVTSDTEKPFVPSYTYELDAASTLSSDLAENAGASKWSVEQ